MSRSTVVLPDPGLPSTRTEAARSGLSDVTEGSGGGQRLRVVAGKGVRMHDNFWQNMRFSSVQAL